jgi:hypothetical protein
VAVEVNPATVARVRMG